MALDFDEAFVSFDDPQRSSSSPVDELELNARCARIADIFRERDTASTQAYFAAERAMFAARGIPVQDRPSSPRAGVGGLHSPPMSPIPRHQQLPHSQPALPPPAPTFPSLPTPQASAQPWTTISSPFDHSWSSRTSPSPHFSEPRPYTAPMLPSSHSTPLQSDHQATFKDWTATALAEEASLEEVKTSAPTNQSPSRIEASASQPSLEWDPSEWEAELMVPSNQASKKRKAFATESPPGQGAPEQEADLMFPRDQAPKKLKTTASHHREIPLPSPIITRSKVSHRTTFWKLGQSFRHGQGAAVRSTRVRKPSTTSQVKSRSSMSQGPSTKPLTYGGVSERRTRK